MKKVKRMSAFANCKGFLKLLLIMKFTIAFLFIASLHVSAKTYSQDRITLKLESVELKTALKQIERKSSFRFLYNDEVLTANRKVTIVANNILVKEVLDLIFGESTLGYKILDNNLVVVTQKNSLIQEVKVGGRVTDGGGNPVANVSVRVKGSSGGTATTGDGYYSLTVPENSVLVFSSIGFETMEENVNGRSEINVSLKTSTKKLDDIVVVGYGTQRRRAVTGAISSVKGDQLAKQPLLTAVQGIQGLAPGIQVVGSSQPGTQPRVTIRGLNTILTNENPLYVVDGVLTDDIRNVNSYDIASVDVLKDGAAAIYGSRAANGVILITTKKGRSGKPNVSFDMFTGFRKLTNQVKMAGRKLYLDYNNEARAYENKPPLTTLDNSANTDWYKEVRQNGMLQNFNLNISGGSDAVTYLFSAGYLKDEGTIKDADYNRITLRLNNEYKLSKMFKLGNVITANISKSTNKPSGVFTDAYRASPAAPVKDASGNYGYQPGLAAAGNPLANLELTNDFSKDQRFQGNFYGEATIIKGLTFRSTWGFDKNNGDNTVYNPLFDYGTIFNNDLPTLFVSESKRFYWVWDNILNYRTKIAENHGIEITAGHSAEKDKSSSIKLRATNVPAQRNLWYITQGDPSITYVADGTGGSVLQRKSIFGRLNYTFKDRYNVSAVLRRDGSSAFPENQKYGTFYSFSGSWVISEESFMKDVTLFDFLKLRGGFAKLGNDGISRIFNNELATLLSVTQTNPYGFPNGIVNGITFDQIKDAAATWETTKSVDMGIEFSLLKQKLTGEISYYNKITNAYIKVPTPPFIDPNGILSQAADVRNKGVEISLNWNQKVNKDFNWKVGVNGTFNKNSVDKIRGGIDLKEGGLGNGQVTTSTVEGLPIGSFWVYQTNGIFQDSSELTRVPHITGTTPGDFKYIDTNGDGVLDERDRVFVGSYQPKFYYGINGSMNFKQFDFSIDCYGNKGNKVYNGKKAQRFGNENIEASRIARWTPSNPSNTEYRASNAIPVPSTYFVESGSFFRINNITIGYSLPESVVSKAFMSRARIFISAQNPLIAKKFSGFSPELPGSNALNSGIELGVYPTSATYMIGLNVNFK